MTTTTEARRCSRCPEREADPTILCALMVPAEYCRANIKSVVCRSRLMTTETTRWDGKTSHAIDGKIADAIHWPEHWDTTAYPTLMDAVYEIVTNAGCSECKKQ